MSVVEQQYIDNVTSLTKHYADAYVKLSLEVNSLLYNLSLESPWYFKALENKAIEWIGKPIKRRVNGFRVDHFYLSRSNGDAEFYRESYEKLKELESLLLKCVSQKD